MEPSNGLLRDCTGDVLQLLLVGLLLLLKGGDGLRRRLPRGFEYRLRGLFRADGPRPILNLAAEVGHGGFGLVRYHFGSEQSADNLEDEAAGSEDEQCF